MVRDQGGEWEENYLLENYHRYQSDLAATTAATMHPIACSKARRQPESQKRWRGLVPRQVWDGESQESAEVRARQRYVSTRVLGGEVFPKSIHSPLPPQSEDLPTISLWSRAMERPPMSSTTTLGAIRLIFWEWETVAIPISCWKYALSDHLNG